MERWTIKPLGLFVLMSLLFLIALILILPQVDLPDTAFNRGTAPVDVHARSISTPGLVSVNQPVTQNFLAPPTSRRREDFLFSGYAISSSRPLLHRSLRC